MRTGLAALATPLFLLTACSDPSTSPAADANTLVASAARGGAPKFWETGATVAWNELTDRLLARRPSNALRVNVYLALAQMRAAQAAETGNQPHPPVSAAIGGASVAVLNAFFPLDIAEIEAALDAQEAADPWPGDKHENFAAGETIGRAIGARVNNFAKSDLLGLTDPGAPPTGPGKWIPNGPPVRGYLGARPFFLSSVNEFLPPPPPAFGSPRYNADLAEVRQISDTRTPEQTAIAVFWHVNQGPNSDAAWNQIVRDLIVKYRTKDADAARLFFLEYAATWDALIGSFGGKYLYWMIRPSQADPGITLPIALPNHPSYPSNHATIDGALAVILEAWFPAETKRIEQIAEEAAMSRLYGGIHYRFDKDAGMALGRATAAKAMAADLTSVPVVP